MSMSLTSEQLVEIGDVVRQLDPTPFEVKVIEVHGHDVHLRKVNGRHMIVGLTNKPKDYSSAPIRGTTGGAF